MSGLQDELLSRIETVAAEKLPTTKSLPVSTGIESGMNECMHDGVNDDDVSESFVLRSVGGTLRSAEVSSVPPAAGSLLSEDAAASLAYNNAHQTQPPIRSGNSPRDSARAIIAGTLGL